MSEANPLAREGAIADVEGAFQDAECIVLEPGDPRYAYIDIQHPDAEAFYQTLDLSAFERAGVSREDIGTLKAFAFACACYLSSPIRTDRYGKPDQPDDHDARSEWVLRNKAQFGATFENRYLANRFRINAMNPLLSRLKSLADLVARHDVMPKKRELQAVLDKIPAEYDPVVHARFNARYTGANLPPPPGLEPGSDLADLMKRLEEVPYDGLKTAPPAPMTFSEKKRFVEELSAAARAYLAIVEK